MFDRVVNVREGFSVPLGARGTIIGEAVLLMDFYLSIYYIFIYLFILFYLFYFFLSFFYML
ncbi:5'-3' exoribonuclease 1 [Portunus trituberculatus]|uniref:5'-3' exoribonuclease 1 n=1 Tax=Portunus trituberculatus TaxID=210409 RepID=A0A5B7JSM7_PORTR|nr:5'-3' exoribonuclease 1 [Portunus trituberculatus]